MTLIRRSPLPWDRLPEPPLEPSQHLAFWQTVGRALDLRVYEAPGTAVIEPPRRRGEDGHALLTLAALALDAPLVADLLDDPSVRQVLVDEGTHGPWAWASGGDDVPPTGKAVQAATEPSDDDQPRTALSEVLYRTMLPDEDRPVEDHQRGAWRHHAELAQEAIVAMLLAAGAVPCPMAWLGLGFASRPELIDRLMASGHPPLHGDHPVAQTWGIGQTALHLAVTEHHPSATTVVDRLLAHGWSADQPDEQGRTPLYLTLDTDRPNDPDTARALLHRLLDQGAAVAWDISDEHAMHVAARAGHRAAVDVLVERGHASLLTRPASDGLIPLNEALGGGHVRLAEHLMALGALPDEQSLATAQRAWSRITLDGEQALRDDLEAAWRRVLVHLEQRTLRAAAQPDDASPQPMTVRRPRI